MEYGGESVPAHAPELGGGHRPAAEGGADERAVGAREGRDDHAVPLDRCRRRRRGPCEPRPERGRDDDAGRPGDRGAERPPAERIRQEGFPPGDDDHRQEETEAVMTVAKCWDCGSENREDARFCDACGARIEIESPESGPQIAPTPSEDEAAPSAMNEDEEALG